MYNWFFLYNELTAKVFLIIFQVISFAIVAMLFSKDGYEDNIFSKLGILISIVELFLYSSNTLLGNTIFFLENTSF